MHWRYRHPGRAGWLHRPLQCGQYGRTRHWTGLGRNHGLFIELEMDLLAFGDWLRDQRDRDDLVSDNVAKAPRRPRC